MSSATVLSFLGVACIVNLTGISQSDVTDYLWLSILLQTLELPIGIICCCIPNLKPVAAEISSAVSPLINRMFCCFRRTRGSEDHLNRPMPHRSSEHDPKARFVRFDEGSTGMEMGRLPGKFLDLEGGLELAFDQGNSIRISKCVSVTSEYYP